MIQGTSQHHIHELPVLVLLPHNRCNCRCVMCDIWKIRQVREITEQDLAPHVSSIRALKVKWIVFSGGEPLMHSDFPALCRALKPGNIRLTLLTSGLSVERHATVVSEAVDDVVVSVDGPPDVHDRIRGVRGAYRQINRGTDALRSLRPEMPIHGRCTVQRENHRHLRRTVRAARALGLHSLSFLAADVTSSAFNRPNGWPSSRQAQTALAQDEVDDLDREIDALTLDCREEMESGFILESAAKLRRIASHFRSHLGQIEASAPRCNAPWVSAVVEADGSVRPCFFHDPIGNIHGNLLAEVLNSETALKFRQQLDVPTNATCKDCVCSLYIAPPGTA